MLYKSTTIVDLIENAATQYGKNIFCSYYGGKVTYEDLHQKSLIYAENLKKAGIKKGMHVALPFSLSIRSIFAFWGIVRCGAVAVAFSSTWNLNKIKEAVKVSDAQVICYDDMAETTYYMKNMEIPGIKRHIPYSELEKKTEIFVQKEILGSDYAAMLFTSGTTSGSMKAVLYNHNNMVISGKKAAEFMRINQHDVLCTVIPMHHCFGMLDNLMAAISVGASLAIPPNRHMESVLKTIVEEKCTVFIAVPTIFHSLISFSGLEQYEIPFLRTGVIAGAAYSKELFQTIEKKLGIHLLASLGLTETTGAITGTEYESSEEVRSTTVGKFLPYIEGKIELLDEKDGIGEICVRGETIFTGYYKMPEINRCVFDEKGWFHTGDIGKLDQDGNLTILGRLKDVIIRGGENILPKEIEECVKKYCIVKNCKAVAVPDEHYGEEICLCVVCEEDVEEEQIKVQISKHLDSYMVPRYILKFDGFPYTCSGKIDLRKIRDMAKERVAYLEETK